MVVIPERRYPGCHAGGEGSRLAVGPNGVPALPRDLKDDRRNDEADDRIGDLNAERDDRRARENTEADETIDARVVAVGHECWTVQPASRSKPYLGRDLVADEAEHT